MDSKEGEIKSDQPTHEEGIRKLGEMIQDLHEAMFTTIDDEGFIHSRPMVTQQSDFDGTLWFFTHDECAKTRHLQKDPRVNVTYSDVDEHRYVSISGTGELSRDRKKMEELWSPLHKAWFPEGLEDPHLALIQVKVNRAEYWDAHSRTMIHLFEAMKSLLSGKPAQGGENRKLNLTG
jgi:general stress protein 26